MTLSFREIADILKAIDESSADEINIEVAGLRLAVRKRSTSSPTPLTSIVDHPEDVEESASSEPPLPSDISSAPLPETPPVPAGHEMLRSPMVGTFYCRPSPDEQPFVEVGSTVVKGDPVCLIEVMKLYTTIEANATGEVVSIYADDGSLIEYNQPLYLIKI